MNEPPPKNGEIWVGDRFTYRIMGDAIYGSPDEPTKQYILAQDQSNHHPIYIPVDSLFKNYVCPEREQAKHWEALKSRLMELIDYV